jgi:hypothetical protein
VDPVTANQPSEVAESGNILGESPQNQIPGDRETIETTETALVTGVKFQAGQPVSSLTSSEIAIAQFLIQNVNNHENIIRKTTKET